MKLHELASPEGATHSRKRVGRGISSGQGKTCGYGTKGAGSRSGRGGKLYFEGGQLPLVRRLAFRPGFTNFNRVPYSPVNVGDLDCFEAGAVVSVLELIAVGLVKNDHYPVKILGDGDLDRPLTLKVDKVSASARTKIEAVGGTVEIL